MKKNHINSKKAFLKNMFEILSLTLKFLRNKFLSVFSHGSNYSKIFAPLRFRYNNLLYI
jgi:hypothetical protein